MYRKIRFTNGKDDATAGLIIDEARYAKETIDSLSRLYPYSEAGKMKVFQSSLPFETWDQAFAFQFDGYRDYCHCHSSHN